MAGRGTTLLELLVVMLIFSLILTTVLGFYVWGHRTTESQSRIADNDRRMEQIVDRIQTLVGFGVEIDLVTDDQIVFIPLDSKAADRRIDNGAANSECIAVLNGQVLLRAPGRSELIVKLLPDESLKFSSDLSTYIDITDTGNPSVSTQGEGQQHPFGVTRRVYLRGPL